MYKINKKTALNILKEVSKIISIDELHNCMKDLSHTDAINIVRNIFGGESREAEYIARQYNIRLSDIPTEIDSDGNKYWRNEEGQLHREDGPAIEFANGSKAWYLNNKLHREDGPAYEGFDGYKTWWIDGYKYSEEEFDKKS